MCVAAALVSPSQGQGPLQGGRGLASPGECALLRCSAHCLRPFLQSQEQPFSFWEKDVAKAAQRQAVAAGQRDPHRFQKPFKANTMPAGVKEPLYTMIAAREQAKKVAYRASREMTVQRTTERLQNKSQDRCAGVAS